MPFSSNSEGEAARVMPGCSATAAAKSRVRMEVVSLVFSSPRTLRNLVTSVLPGHPMFVPPQRVSVLAFVAGYCVNLLINEIARAPAGYLSHLPPQADRR